MNELAMLISTAATTAATENPFQEMANPVISLLNMVVGPALAIVGALGAIFVIILGVKYAKAEEPQDREKAKHSLRNAIIGFVLIFVLLVALNVGMPALTNWANSQMTSSTTSSQTSSR